MEIHESQIEWAVIDRLRGLLEQSRRSEFEVTEAFAHFSAIVCWVAQRMRAKGNSPADDAARRFFKAMRNLRMQDVPGAPRGIDLSVACAVVSIRNSCAHADGRTVRPMHRRAPGRPPSLVGFEFVQNEGSIRLNSTDMVDFGTWLADEFIRAMSAGPNDLPNPANVREVVGAIREIRR